MNVRGIVKVPHASVPHRRVQSIIEESSDATSAQLLYLPRVEAYVDDY